MNIVEVTIRGPVNKNLAEIIVSDDFQNDVFCVDYTTVEKARAAGKTDTAITHRELLDLIYNNGGSDAIDILQAAAMNGSPVNIDGETISFEVLRSIFNAPKP